MSEPIHYDRRRFIGTAVMAVAATRLGGSPSREPAPGSRDDAIKQIKAGPPDLRRAEAGPSDGPPVILLSDGNSDVDVAPLASRGYRVIVPKARVSDVIPLMAALKIEKALVVGVGESARTAEVIAALWPQRLKCIAPVSGLVGVALAANQRALPPKEELGWWYRYYFLRNRVG